MDLKTLQNFDIKNLKNLNISQIKDNIFGQPTIFINILLIGLTIFATIYIYKNNRLQSQKLTQELQEKQKKTALVGEYTGIEKEYTTVLNGFPEFINTDELINKLSQYAVEHNVQIVNYLRTDPKKDEFSEQAMINLNIAAEAYKDIILFVNDIEKSPYAVRIGRWSAERDIRPYTYGARASRDQPMDKEDRIKVNLEIVSIKIKK